MKSRERGVIKYLNYKGLKLKESFNKYNSFDAYDNNYIVEIKVRDKYYSDKMLEASKLYTNYQQAQLSNKYFLYVVKDSRGTWIYNISRDIDKIISSEPQKILCPAQTEFNNNKKIFKICYLLPDSMALQV